MCSVVRKLVAYAPVDWVAPRPKPIKLSKPEPPSRKSLHARLKKLESEAEQLREQLKKLDELRRRERSPGAHERPRIGSRPGGCERR
jgi:hypothetical protein